MATKQTGTKTKTLAQLTKDDVLRSYSGRPGCMCGCLGHYKYNPYLLAEAQADAKADGHGGLEPGDFSSRSVSIVLGKLQKLVASGAAQAMYDDGGAWVSAQDEAHSYTVYLRGSTRVVDPSSASHDLAAFDPSKI